MSLAPSMSSTRVPCAPSGAEAKGTDDDAGSEAAAAPPIRIAYENTWRDQLRFSAVHQFLSVKLQFVTVTLF